MRIITLFALFLLVACSEPPDPPTYRPPSNDDAESAFKSAFRADVLEHPYKLAEEPPDIDASNYQAFQDYNDKKLANEHAIEAFDAFRWMSLGKCVWERYTIDDVPDWAKARITTDPKAAYHCSFKLHYQINAPYGDPKTTDTEGYFFKVVGGFAYAGKFDTPY